MNVINNSLYNISVTIKYKHLDRGLISRDGLRKLVPENQEVIISDLPDILLVVFTHNNFHIIIDEDKVTISCQVDKGEADYDLLADITRKMVELIDKGEISAYGFNYIGKAECEAEVLVADYFIRKFMKPNTQLETTFGGVVSRVAPQFSLTKNDCTFNISMNPETTPQAFKYNLNVHYNKDRLPPKQKISQSLINQYEVFNVLLEKF